MLARNKLDNITKEVVIQRGVNKTVYENNDTVVQTLFML